MSGVLTDRGYPALELLPPGHVPSGIVRGRSVHDGYQRGAGLEFGQLRERVAAHPLFKEALTAASGRSIMAMDRLMNLFLIMVTRFERLSGQDIIEFGSYRGGSVLFMGTVLKKLFPGARVYGLDTFEGMPKTDVNVDIHGAGDFADTSIESIRQAAADLKLDNVVLVKGLIEDTFPTQLPAEARFAIAHIDLDIYWPIKYAQDTVWDRMVQGGYIVYDDATASSCIGATQAVEDLLRERPVSSEQIFPHFVFRAGLSDGPE